MPDYDAALKLLLQKAGHQVTEMLAGAPIVNWLNVELPKTQNLRMDLLGEDAAGNLHHFELQSANDSQINLRMAEYTLAIYRTRGKFPRQAVLYVGEAPLRMPSELSGPEVLIRYQVIDIRQLDGETLLASEDLGDNLIAILTPLRDHREAIRGIVAKIASLPAGREQNEAVQQLVILAGLRRLGPTVQEEVQHMPLIIDIMENDLLGPEIRRRVEKGREEAIQEGRQEGRLAGRQEGQLEGRQKGQQRLLSIQIEKRFGPLPAWASAKLATLSVEQIEAIGESIFDAPTLEHLLR